MSKPRRRGSPWRVLAQGGAERVSLECAGTEFDELVVGDWLHIERMSEQEWWMQIGGVVLGVTVLRDKRKRVRVMERKTGRQLEDE